MSADIMNLGFLTTQEREIIRQVLIRDQDLKKLDAERIKSIKWEIRELRKKSALRAGDPSVVPHSYKRGVCTRCHAELGFICNSGRQCPRCKHRVCSKCQTSVTGRRWPWLCVLCYKQGLLPGLTGEWFYSKQMRASMSGGRKASVAPPSAGSMVKESLFKTCNVEKTKICTALSVDFEEPTANGTHGNSASPDDHEKPLLLSRADNVEPGSPTTPITFESQPTELSPPVKESTVLTSLRGYIRKASLTLGLIEDEPTHSVVVQRRVSNRDPESSDEDDDQAALSPGERCNKRALSLPVEPMTHGTSKDARPNSVYPMPLSDTRKTKENLTASDRNADKLLSHPRLYTPPNLPDKLLERRRGSLGIDFRQTFTPPPQRNRAATDSAAMASLRTRNEKRSEADGIRAAGGMRSLSLAGPVDLREMKEKGVPSRVEGTTTEADEDEDYTVEALTNVKFRRCSSTRPSTAAQHLLDPATVENLKHLYDTTCDTLNQTGSQQTGASFPFPDLTAHDLTAHNCSRNLASDSLTSPTKYSASNLPPQFNFTSFGAVVISAMGADKLSSRYVEAERDFPQNIPHTNLSTYSVSPPLSPVQVAAVLDRSEEENDFTLDSFKGRHSYHSFTFDLDEDLDDEPFPAASDTGCTPQIEVDTSFLSTENEGRIKSTSEAVDAVHQRRESCQSNSSSELHMSNACSHDEISEVTLSYANTASHKTPSTNKKKSLHAYWKVVAKKLSPASSPRLARRRLSTIEESAKYTGAKSSIASPIESSTESPIAPCIVSSTESPIVPCITSSTESPIKSATVVESAGTPCHIVLLDDDDEDVSQIMGASSSATTSTPVFARAKTHLLNAVMKIRNRGSHLVKSGEIPAHTSLISSTASDTVVTSGTDHGDESPRYVSQPTCQAPYSPTNFNPPLTEHLSTSPTQELLVSRTSKLAHFVKSHWSGGEAPLASNIMSSTEMTSSSISPTEPWCRFTASPSANQDPEDSLFDSANQGPEDSLSDSVIQLADKLMEEIRGLHQQDRALANSPTTRSYTEEPTFCTGEPTFCTDEPTFCTGEPTCCTDEPTFCMDEPTIDQQEIPSFLGDGEPGLLHNLKGDEHPSKCGAKIENDLDSG